MAENTLPLFADAGKFYVYVYRDPRPRKKNVPIYVGKGTAANRRADKHWNHGATNPMFINVLEKIRNAGLKPAIEIVGWFDDEDSALYCEMELIRKIGRRDINTGSLCNLNEGGIGPVIISETTRKRMSDAAKARETNSFAGKHHSDETKQILREFMRGRAHHSEEWKNELRIRMTIDNPFKGKKHTEETRCLIGEMNKKRDLSKFTTKGLTFGIETRLKISRALTGITRSPETRLKMSMAQRRRKEEKQRARQESETESLGTGVEACSPQPGP